MAKGAGGGGRGGVTVDIRRLPDTQFSMTIFILFSITRLERPNLYLR